MIKGYICEILEVKLPAKQATAVKLDEKVVRDFIGGIGMKNSI